MPGSPTRGGLSRGRTSADLAVDDARSERRHHPLRNREERWEGRESDSEAVEAQVEKDRKEQAKAAAKAKAVNKLKEQHADDWTKEEDAKLRQAVLAIGTADWASVAERVGDGRQPQACKGRWGRLASKVKIKANPKKKNLGSPKHEQVLEQRKKALEDANEEMRKLTTHKDAAERTVKFAEPAPRRKVRSLLDDLPPDDKPPREPVKNWGSKTEVLRAVGKNGHALQHASAPMRGSKEVVLAAVANQGCALKHASDKMRSRRDIVLAAVDSDPYAVHHALGAARSDRAVLHAAMQKGVASRWRG